MIDGLPRNPLKWFRALTGVVILTVAAWAFWPPERRPDELTPATALEVGDPNARFALEVAPGLFYMPGTTPGGFGEKLKGFRDVARDFVKIYPDTRIIFRNVPARNREWLTTSLAGTQAPDLLSVNVEDVWVDVQKNWYLPLDDYLEKPNPFVAPGQPGSRQWWDMFKYEAISRGKAAPLDGRMYCISYDMVETGIFYNRTKFDELGIDPPSTWAEFLEIQQTIKDAGYIPFTTVVEAISDWAVDLIFDQLYYEILPGIDLWQDPVREPYLQGYLDWDEVAFLNEKGFFTADDPRYRACFRILHDWRKYWNKDLSIRTMDRVRPFLRQEALMIWEGSWFTHRLVFSKSATFEWDVFYLPPITRETSTFAPAEPLEMCVVGGAGQQFSVTKRAWSDAKKPADSERLKRVIAFLQFMCLPENVDRIVNESVMFLPNIVGVEARPEMQPFVEILEGRYTTTKWVNTFDLQYYDALNRMLALYLNGGCDLDGFLEVMDDFMRLAAERAIQRKKPDLDRLQRAWDRLAPLRAEMTELPDGAR